MEKTQIKKPKFYLKIFYKPEIENSILNEEGIFPIFSSTIPGDVQNLAKTLKENDLEAKLIDYTTVPGFSEGRYYQIGCTPSAVLVDEYNGKITHWEGRLPKITDVVYKVWQQLRPLGKESALRIVANNSF